jgi:hypothetical protein
MIYSDKARDHPFAKYYLMNKKLIRFVLKIIMNFMLVLFHSMIIFLWLVLEKNVKLLKF